MAVLALELGPMPHELGPMPHTHNAAPCVSLRLLLRHRDVVLGESTLTAPSPTRLVHAHPPHSQPMPHALGRSAAPFTQSTGRSMSSRRQRSSVTTSATHLAVRTTAMALAWHLVSAGRQLWCAAVALVSCCLASPAENIFSGFLWCRSALETSSSGR